MLSAELAVLGASVVMSGGLCDGLVGEIVDPKPFEQTLIRYEGDRFEGAVVVRMNGSGAFEDKFVMVQFNEGELKEKGIIEVNMPKGISLSNLSLA